MSEDKKLVEFIELPLHPFFIATQAHPEFKSSLMNPSPLFMGFIEACLKKSEMIDDKNEFISTSSKVQSQFQKEEFQKLNEDI